MWMTCRISALVLVLGCLLSFCGCFVQSVYPWYQDEDIVFDGSLAGTWVGEGQLQPCILVITSDSKGRSYNIEISKLGEIKTSVDCEAAKLTGRILQLGHQRFLDIIPVEEKCSVGLHTILRIKSDPQTLSLVSIDPDFMESLLIDKTSGLQARIDETGSALVNWIDVTLTSPSGDLRKFLRDHSEDKALFAEADMLHFRRK